MAVLGHHTPVYKPTRKRFKPSKDGEDIVRADQAENAAMAKAYERAVQFKTSLKAIITWHSIFIVSSSNTGCIKKN